MGNCFSKGPSSGKKGSNFTGEGRTLGGSGSAAPRPAAAPATATSGGVISYGTVNKPASASVPPAKTTTARTGTAGSGGGAGRTLGGPEAEGESEDPKSKAAQAALARFQKDQGTGDLSKKLRAQKGMTRDTLLKEESERERAWRAADQAAEARNYN